MGYCIACGEDLIEVVESDTDAKFSTVTVREYSGCGPILGVTNVGL